jgi:hypothetical protein
MVFLNLKNFVIYCNIICHSNKHSL